MTVLPNNGIPLEAQYLYRHAQDLSMVGKKEDALRYLKMAVVIAPRFCKAYNAMGNCLDELGRYEDAIRKYDKVIDIDPLHAEARFKRTLVIEKLRQSEAVKWNDGKQKVLEKEPGERRTGIPPGVTQNGEFPFMLMRTGLNC
jgi:tetratricopeptide (TPR) repeat protein